MERKRARARPENRPEQRPRGDRTWGAPEAGCLVDLATFCRSAFRPWRRIRPSTTSLRTLCPLLPLPFLPHHRARPHPVPLATFFLSDVVRYARLGRLLIPSAAYKARTPVYLTLDKRGETARLTHHSPPPVPFPDQLSVRQPGFPHVERTASRKNQSGSLVLVVLIPFVQPPHKTHGVLRGGWKPELDPPARRP